MSMCAQLFDIVAVYPYNSNYIDSMSMFRAGLQAVIAGKEFPSPLAKEAHHSASQILEWP